MRRCACGDHSCGRDDNTVDVDVAYWTMYSQDSMKWGCVDGSLRALFVPAYWKVRVLRTYGIVDRPSDLMYVHNIPLYGCMYRCYRYICQRKPQRVSVFYILCRLVYFLVVGGVELF